MGKLVKATGQKSWIIKEWSYKGLSLVDRNAHAGFLGELGSAMGPDYPASLGKPRKNTL